MTNDGDAPEVSLNARDKFRIITFYVIIDNPNAEMSRRGQAHNDKANRFSCVVNVPETSSTKESVQHSVCCEQLINAYPEGLSSNLFTEHQRFHSCISHKLSAPELWNTKFSNAEINKVAVKDNIECAFPNVEISLSIYFNIYGYDLSAHFFQFQHKNPNRVAMWHEKFDSLSLLMIEADLLG